MLRPPQHHVRLDVVVIQREDRPGEELSVWRETDGIEMHDVKWNRFVQLTRYSTGVCRLKPADCIGIPSDQAARSKARLTPPLGFRGDRQERHVGAICGQMIARLCQSCGRIAEQVLYEPLLNEGQQMDFMKPCQFADKMVTALQNTPADGRKGNQMGKPKNLHE